ncbi:hypothetical protein B0H17DRAFT_1112416 [Mycena rosella]|uniref:F-box domain-containing protein n=1 Tax=Mycena rosella TaxID=1033263 RepID=A0AAD7BJ96_MYCRO|nr:hypothetical protein B0H17DRAFT_1112416 [Mycena rosella]
MESPFTHRLHTNYVPSDEETAQIQSDLASHSQELARIDERIRELTAQRDKIRNYIDSHKALISYPRRLPPDILGEIFIACLPVDRNAVMSVDEAPLVLCRICSAWRTLALSTPRLWASLHTPASFILVDERRVAAVLKWLQRSGACPLSLTFIGEGWDWAPSIGPGSIRALVEDLAASSDRWRDIKFCPLSHEAATGLAKVQDTPMLESIQITTSAFVLRQIDLSKAPRLHTIILEVDDHHGPRYLLLLPWSEHVLSRNLPSQYSHPH